MERLQVRAWRMMDAEPFGVLVWFDPSCEVVQVFSVAKGSLERIPVEGVRSAVRGHETDNYDLFEAQIRSSSSDDDLPF